MGRSKEGAVSWKLGGSLLKLSLRRRGYMCLEMTCHRAFRPCRAAVDYLDVSNKHGLELLYTVNYQIVLCRAHRCTCFAACCSGRRASL